MFVFIYIPNKKFSNEFQDRFHNFEVFPLIISTLPLQKLLEKFLGDVEVLSKALWEFINYAYYTYKSL